jgi:uncharacterized protein YjiS (DUF1127 family)
MSLNPACGAIAAPMSGATVNLPVKKPTPSLARVLAAIATQLEKLSTALRHRRELAQLARFSDRELRDLAVTRNDIAFAMSGPLWRDPAIALRQARRPGFEGGGACGTATRRPDEKRQIGGSLARFAK